MSILPLKHNQQIRQQYTVYDLIMSYKFDL